MCVGRVTGWALASESQKRMGFPDKEVISGMEGQFFLCGYRKRSGSVQVRC